MVFCHPKGRRDLNGLGRMLKPEVALVHNWAPQREDISERQGIALHVLNLGSRLDVSHQSHSTDALPPGKESLIPIRQKAEWVQELCWMLWRQVTSLPVLGT